MDFKPLLPEILLLSLALAALGLDWLLPKNQKKDVGRFCVIGLAGIFALLYLLVDQPALVMHIPPLNKLALPSAVNLTVNVNGSDYFQGFVMDGFSAFFKELFLLTALIVFVFSGDYFKNDAPNMGEYAPLLLFVTLGCFFLVSAADLLTLFVSFELMSLPLYVLCGYLKKDSKSGEAGLKYFLMGAVTSGVLLFGISLIYLSLGTTDLRHLISSYGPITVNRLFSDPTLLTGILFVLSAFAFKIAAVPFHMWLPDVYEGAPTPVAAYLAAAPKIAVIGMLMRTFLSGMTEAAPFWVLIFAVLSALSMTVGNLLALRQQNLKRLLAYSGISQMGFILAGLAAVAPIASGPPFTQLGYQGVLFYAVVYVLSELAAFGVVTYMSGQGRETVKDYAGMSTYSPLMSLALLVALLSLAGVPLLGGFVAKFYVLTAAFNGGLYWLVVLGLVNSVISLFYYLRVARAMYFEKPQAEIKLTEPSLPMQLSLWLVSLLVVAFGIYPNFVVWQAQAALQKFLAGY